MRYPYTLPAGFFAVTSTVADGNMDFRFGVSNDVERARAQFCSEHAPQVKKLAVCHVEIADRIITVDAATDISQPLHCDALVTRERGVGLFLLTADCIPLICIDVEHSIVALVHLGWKPTALSLAKKTIEQMVSLGASVDAMHVYAGPGIHAASYLCTDPEQRNDPAWADCITHVSGNQYAVDLYKKNYLEILATGIPAHQVHMDAPDTFSDTHFFSHYRAQRTGEPEGRIATLVCCL